MRPTLTLSTLVLLLASIFIGVVTMSVPAQQINGGQVSPAFRVTGGTCTNQAATAISATGVPTCTSLTSAYVSGTTGSGNFVLQGTPTLTTPEIGAATGTSLQVANGGSISSPGIFPIGSVQSGLWFNTSTGRVGLGYANVPAFSCSGGPGCNMRGDQVWQWNSTNVVDGTADLSISRSAANTLAVGTGTQGSVAGTVSAAVVTAGTGYRVAGAAAAGTILIGNGTNYVVGTPASVNANPANQTGNSTVTLKMNGLGAAAAACKLTPATSGRVGFNISGQIVQSTTADGIAFKMTYGTTTPPANSAAAEGTALTPTMTHTALTGALEETFSVTGVATGLALVQTWFDLQVAEVSGGTASITNVTCSAWEF